MIGIDRVLDALRQSFRLSTDTEITLEMDPGTFNQPRLNRLQGLGINRVSVGVQSFDQTILNRAGRAHSVEDVYTAVDALHGSRIQNFNIDLISSLPFLTLDLWDDTLRKAIDCKSTHLSVYDLQVEEKTAFGRWYTPGSFPLPAEESCVEMYKHASSVLCQRGGFEHYEVSNYAKGGHRSRHNQKYWRLDSVYGFGMAAASYCGNVRFTRPNSMQAYTSWLEKIEGQKELLTEVGIDQIEGSKVDPVEFIMLALRTKDGLSMSQLQSLCGEGVMRSVNNALQDNVDRGLVFKSLQGDGVVFRLADPEGFIVSNDIISSVLAVID